MNEPVNSQGFVHLRVRSAYSLLEGAIKAAKVGKLAADAGMPAVGVADRANLFGALEFSQTAFRGPKSRSIQHHFIDFPRRPNNPLKRGLCQWRLRNTWFLHLE